MNKVKVSRLSIINTFLLIFLIIIIQTTCGSATEINCGDVVKMVLSKDSSQVKGRLEEKGPERICIFNSLDGLRFFDSSEIARAYVCKSPRNGAVRAGAGIGMLVGGAIACYFEWPKKEDAEVNMYGTTVVVKGGGEYHETNLWVILAGIVGGALLGAGIGSLFIENIEVNPGDLFMADPKPITINQAFSPESISLLVKLKL